MCSYRNVSKTDIKAAWLKNPKSARPKELMTIEALHPPSRPDYRYVTSLQLENMLSIICTTCLGCLGRQ